MARVTVHLQVASALLASLAVVPVNGQDIDTATEWLAWKQQSNTPAVPELFGLTVADETPENRELCRLPRHSRSLDEHWLRAQERQKAPYSCRSVNDERDVDIEHIVAKAEALDSGLDCDLGRQFVNDLDNITVAFPKLNREDKVDKDIAEWQPEHNLCWFAQRVVDVKLKYDLTMDQDEHDKLAEVLGSCLLANAENWSCPPRRD